MSTVNSNAMMIASTKEVLNLKDSVSIMIEKNSIPTVMYVSLRLVTDVL
jgi:hypothetical protein